MSKHSELTPSSGGIHVIQSYEYANAAARTGATGLVPADVGRVARQLDNNSFWVLTDDSPVTWAAMSGGGGSNNYLQSVFNEVAVNTSTTSVAFVTLLSQAITKQTGTILKVHFTCGTANSSNNQTNYFRIQVDGVTQRAVGTRLATAGQPGPASIVLRIAGLAAGARVVTVQWRTSGGTAQIRPVASPDQEHASLLLEEVTV